MFSLNSFEAFASILLQNASSARRAFARRPCRAVSEHACSIGTYWRSRCCAPLQPSPAVSSAQGQLHCSLQLRGSGRSGCRRDDGRGLLLRRVAARRLRRHHGNSKRNRRFRGSARGRARPLATRWSTRRLAGGTRSTREVPTINTRPRLHIEGRRRDPCALLRVVAGRRVAPATGADTPSRRRSSSGRPCGTPTPGPGGRRTS